MATALLPMPLLATHVYPNMLGAALIASAFRWGFTAPVRRPALAAALLALTLFLTPRDAIALLVLGPFLLWPAADRRRVAIAAGLVLLLVVIANGLLYGLPIPYASYVFGTGQAQDLTRQGSITLFLWVTLPAILFDRTFGIAGTAPWAFVGLAGLIPALRWERAMRLDALPPASSRRAPVLLPAALAVGVSVVALGFFRLWEGGYAPPARYFVDVLPLWMPFVAAGLALVVARAARTWSSSAAAAALVFAAIVIGVSAVTSLILNAAPALALNSAFDDKIRDAVGKTLGIDPLGWLPSFQPLTPTWYIGAYLRVLPAIAIAAALVVFGRLVGRSVAAEAEPPGDTPHGRYAFSGQDDPISGQIDPKSGQVDPKSGHFDPKNHVSAHGVGWGRRAVGEAGVLLEGTDGALAGGAEGAASTAAGPSTAGHARTLRDAGAHGEASANALTIVFLLLNVLAIALVIVATQQPWVAAGPDPVPDSLYRKWLPLSLAIATIATALIGRALGSAAAVHGSAREQQAALYRRHYALYLVPLALMLVARFGEGSAVTGALGAIYLLVAVGFAANALRAVWRAVESHSDRRVALELGLIALAAALVLLPYHRAVMPTASDEPHYLIITQSLLYDRDLDLANDYAGTRYEAFYPSRLPDIHGVQVGSAVYSIRDLGLPILGVIPYAIAGRLGVLALLCIAGAALAAQLYLLARDVGFSARASFLTAACAALTHPVFTYTTQAYPELLTALAFVTAARLMRAGTRTGVRDLALASALLGSLPWLSTRAWPIVAGAGLVLAVVALRPAWGRPRDLALRFVAGAGPFAALVLALCFLNWRTLGLFLPGAGYFMIREQQPVLTFTFWIGGPGLFFDRVFGLIPRAPVYLLAFLGTFPLIRRARGHQAELAAVALGSILSFVYIADIAYWWADGSPPSRYLLASLPLLVVAMAGGWEVVRGAWRAAAALAVVASALVVYVYAVLPNTRYDLALEVAASGSPGGLFAFLDRALGANAGIVFPSLVRPDVLSVALALAWLVLAAGLVMAGRARD